MFNFRPHGAGGTIKVNIEEKGTKRQSTVPVKAEHKDDKSGNVGGTEEKAAEAEELIAKGYSDVEDDGDIRQVNCPESVSYTHLTLPTILRV